MFPAFLTVLLIRMLFCTSVPFETSDLYRQLGFASHLFGNLAGFYRLDPADFAGEAWTECWPEHGYIYPPLCLLFFAFFGSLGIGMFWVKLVLTACDAASSWIIGRNTSWWAALIVFSAPAGVWYTSHEGEIEALVTLFVVISLFAARGGSWTISGASFLLALQTKQLSLLLLPALLHEAFQLPPGERGRAAVRFGGGVLGALIPFLPFYHWRPDLWLLPLSNQGIPFNPFHWPLTLQGGLPEHFRKFHPFLLVWDGIIGTLPLLLLLMFLAGRSFRERLPQALPSLGFWGLIKTANWVMNWYVNMLPGLTAALWRHPRWMLLLLGCYWLQFGQQAAIVWNSLTPDRDAYLVGAGILVACTWLAADLFDGLTASWGAAIRRAVGVVAAASLLGILAVVSRQETGLWSDPVTFWRRVVSSTRDNAAARFLLARGLLDFRDGAGAEKELREGLLIEPGNAGAHALLASALGLQGRGEEALAESREAVRLDPENPLLRARLEALLGILNRGGATRPEH